ncbi:MAG: hypothetical protein KF905_00155 [Flavobacteriales bacterium]|nr:hypothetical protein [Flavobacteriales bacterium]
MKNVPEILFKEAPVLVAEESVLSPESYVFVALMSVEEGLNKASFLAFPEVLVGERSVAQ